MTRTTRSRAIALSVAACLVTAAAGCGTSSSSGLSHAALVKRVDTICKRHNEIITAAASKVLAGGNLPSPAVFGKLAHQTIIPQYAAEITTLGALKPASSDATKYHAWLATSHATLMRMQQNPRIITSSANFTAINREADALGFSSFCHVGPGG
ncbi:MAG: hypothetical protein M3071_01830 [Actinomycetota bacterium]|nr:hypothetical protein [Actinomycetota bacterium]